MHLAHVICHQTAAALDQLPTALPGRSLRRSHPRRCRHSSRRCLLPAEAFWQHPAMVGGNPFAKREGGAQKEDLLAGAERSDAPWHDDEEAAPPPVALPANSASRRRRSTSLPSESAQTESRAAAEPGAAELGSLPPPPPLVPAPLASEPPPPGGAEPALPAGVAPGVPYYPPAPGTAGAWGSGTYGSGSYGSTAPPGVPPPAGGAGGGAYGGGPADYYATQPPQPPYGQPTMAAAWTAGYPAADQPLTYQTFEQQGGGTPPGKMRCGGLGEQWTVSQAEAGSPPGHQDGWVVAMPCCSCTNAENAASIVPASSTVLPTCMLAQADPAPPAPRTPLPPRPSHPAAQLFLVGLIIWPLW